MWYHPDSTARIRVAALVVALVVGMLLPATGRADPGIGVAMDVGKIEVTQRLAKGGTYQLPIIGIRNPGSEPSVYEMGVGHIQGQKARPPSEDWFSFSPREFRLEPGAVQAVRIQLDIPVDADPDGYAALIHAQVAPAGGGGQVGAAAAAPVTFTIKPSTLLEAMLLRSRRTVDDWSPWSYLLPALAVLVIGGRWVGRRFRLNFRVERRR
jgi:hypothetical protein